MTITPLEAFPPSTPRSPHRFPIDADARFGTRRGVPGVYVTLEDRVWHLSPQEAEDLLEDLEQAVSDLRRQS